MHRSSVVTGAGGGIGRVIPERLLADGGAVVVLDHETAALSWVNDAAVFRNACIDAAPAHEVSELISANEPGGDRMRDRRRPVRVWPGLEQA